MSVYALTPLAKADIFDIWRFIAVDSEDAADRVEQAIYDACSIYRPRPHERSFQARPHNAPAAFLDGDPLPNYSIVYRPETVPVEVIAVFHGKRNIRRALKQR